MRSLLTVIAIATFATGCEGDLPHTAAGQYALAHPGPWDIPPEVLEAGDQHDVDVVSAGPWRGPDGCGGTFTSGARRLQDWIRDHWPQVSSIGGYSCRPINGNPNVMSVHATGRALDIFIPLDGGEADNDLGDPLANWLVVHAEEVGIQRVIWDRWIWAPDRQPGSRERAYNGAHPHHDHLHVELSVAASREETPFFRAGMPPPDMGACGDPLPAEGGVVDDDHPCFSAFGPGQFWRSVGGQGVGGGLLWTNAFENDSPSNWARWRFELSRGGPYEVEAHVVSEFAVHDAVRYGVRHGDREDEVVVDPSGRDGWVPIGRFEFAAGETQWVSVFDHSDGPVGDDRHIAVDAIRLRAPGVEPPPPDAGPPPPDQGPPADAAPPRPDLGEPLEEDFGPAPDFGEPPSGDVGGSERDAGEDERPFTPFDPARPGQTGDAGAPGSDAARLDGGCAQTPASPPPLWLLLALCVLRRRRA